MAVSAFQISSAAEDSKIEAIVEVDDLSIVNATGEIVPKQLALLSLSAGGVAREVPVMEGDFVQAGDMLVRLEGETQLETAISAAKLELANAEFALKQLYD